MLALLWRILLMIIWQWWLVLLSFTGFFSCFLWISACGRMGKAPGTSVQDYFCVCRRFGGGFELSLRPHLVLLYSTLSNSHLSTSLFPKRFVVLATQLGRLSLPMRNVVSRTVLRDASSGHLVKRDFSWIRLLVSVLCSASTAHQNVAGGVTMAQLRPPREHARTSGLRISVMVRIRSVPLCRRLFTCARTRLSYWK